MRMPSIMLLALILGSIGPTLAEERIVRDNRATEAEEDGIVAPNTIVAPNNRTTTQRGHRSNRSGENETSFDEADSLFGTRTSVQESNEAGNEVVPARRGRPGAQAVTDDNDGGNYIGEVFLTAAYYCPRNTIEAAGQSLPINENQALFSLLGTQWGGDGRTTFNLPDLRQSVPSDGRGARTRYCVVLNGAYPPRN